jgi:hypothetical protein
MALYTLHLGFNWNSPLIGSIWGTGNVPEPYRFLQYALAAGDGETPSWFQFDENDQLSVTVWDLSPSPVPMALDLAMSLSYCDAPQTYNPSDYWDVGQSVTHSPENGQYYFTYTNISGGPTSTLSKSPWGDCYAKYTATVPTQTGFVTFTNNVRCKLSFRLKAVASGTGNALQVYLSDPEVIVGSGR